MPKSLKILAASSMIGRSDWLPIIIATWILLMLHSSSLNSNNQISNHKQFPNHNDQIYKPAFRYWNFDIVCNLVLGIWLLNILQFFTCAYPSATARDANVSAPWPRCHAGKSTGRT